MIKYALALLLALSSSAFATQQQDDDADELAAENVGMTLVGYRHMVYCKDLTARVTKAEKDRAHRKHMLGMEFSILDIQRATLEMRSKSVMRDTTVEADIATWSARVDKYTADVAQFNKSSVQLDAEIEAYNAGDCAPQ